MRTAYCKALYKIMSEDKRVFALTADIGFKNFDKIIADYPDRFINVGVAEANMMSVAAGLAMSGKIPFTFTIAPFVTMRCLEQIRVDICYHKLPVKIIGAGGGFVYGPQGTTHHAIEEIGILRSLPEMTILSPCDPIETKMAIIASMDLDGPAYIRIGRNNEPDIHTPNYAFTVGKNEIIREGKDIVIFAHGLVVKNVIDAAEILEQDDVNITIVNSSTIKPINQSEIVNIARQNKIILTVEEHNIIGGLGSTIAEILSEALIDNVCLFKRLGINDSFIRENAEHKELQKKYNLDKFGVVRTIKKMLLQIDKP